MALGKLQTSKGILRLNYLVEVPTFVFEVGQTEIQM